MSSRSEGTAASSGERKVNAATDGSGVLRIVATEEYEAKKGPGIGAPYPGREWADLYPWAADERVFYRPSDDAEWVELDRLAADETFPLSPGSSIRLDAPRGIWMSM